MEETRILWVGRHNPTDRQRKQLKEIFGQYKLVIRNKTISNAQQVVDMMKKNNCKEVMAVLPQPLRRELVNELGVKPLYAEVMKLGRNEKGKPKYKHQCFYRVEQEQKLKRLTPKRVS